MRPLTFALTLCFLAGVPAAAARPGDPPEYVIHDLGSFDDRGETVALAINDRGEIVGAGRASSGLSVPFYWSASTGFVKILMGMPETRWTSMRRARWLAGSTRTAVSSDSSGADAADW